MPPVLIVPNVTAVVVPLLHSTWLAGWLTCADGFTVIVNDFDGPVQLAVPSEYVGVTVMVAVTGDDPILTAVNEAIFPVPDAGSPIDGVLFVQEYAVVPPGLVVVKLTALALLPLHTTWLDG